MLLPEDVCRGPRFTDAYHGTLISPEDYPEVRHKLFPNIIGRGRGALILHIESQELQKPPEGMRHAPSRRGRYHIAPQGRKDFKFRLIRSGDIDRRLSGQFHDLVVFTQAGDGQSAEPTGIRDVLNELPPDSLTGSPSRLALGGPPTPPNDLCRVLP